MAPRAEPREPSPAEVAAADERRPPPRVQYCLAHPSCGGVSACTDCRAVEDCPPEEDEAAPAQDGALATRAAIERLRNVVGQVVEGLDGRPFTWSDAQRTQFVPMLRSAGVHLVTVTSAKKAGHVLKRGAKPAGRSVFGSPPTVVHHYVLHVQTKLAAAKTSASAQPGATT